MRPEPQLHTDLVFQPKALYCSSDPTPRPPPPRGEGVFVRVPSSDIPEAPEIRGSSPPLPLGEGVGGWGPTSNTTPAAEKTKNEATGFSRGSGIKPLRGKYKTPTRSIASYHRHPHSRK